MNRKVLVMAVALMAVAMLATPVMAKSPNKVPAAAVITGVGGFDPVTVDVKVTDDGIVHYLYLKMWGTIDLYLDGQSPIPVEWVDECRGIYNPVSNTGKYYFDEVWTLPDGELVGVDHLSVVGDIFGAYDTMHTHIILTGVPGGVYDGQMLNLWMDTASDTPYFVGFWLKSS
jgi:hypothetical protein